MTPTVTRVCRRILVATFAAIALTLLASAQEKPSVAQLAFLTGTWRGTSSSGATAEELISAPEGGVMLAAGREFNDGRCTFYDLVVFAEQEGAVLLIPHPAGRRSPRTFPLVKFEADAKRATFANPEHDFPQTFTYELVAPDRLRITLTGVQKGQPAKEVYELKLAP